MPKRKKKEQADDVLKDNYVPGSPQAAPPGPMPAIPRELEEKLTALKAKLDDFKKQVVDKFDKYIFGITLLPPPKPEDLKEGDNKDAVHILVLIDDLDSKKMTKDELKVKLTDIIISMATNVDKNLTPQVLLLSELWQSCFDQKYDLLQTIALSAPIYETGMVSAIKIAEVHKQMVLKKFEKYIVSYVLAGSLTQGRATPTSDIDVWIVIDDTDVKKMTRAELKDKLRAIIIGMGMEAGQITGIRNKINIQVYILTDFWDSLKEANPVIFTLLRDGVPFFDRGIFMPWKQLLKMGRIKPSAEAIDMFMNSGDQMLERVHFKLKDIGMEDIYYALLTPSQAALMLFGLAPPAPRETPEIMREVFVQKHALIEESYIKILERVIKIRKDIEHGTKKEITGKEIDELLKDAEDYLKRVKKLFEQIETRKQEEDVLNMYDTVVTVIRDVLRLEGIEQAEESKLIKLFEDELITKGRIPAKYLRVLGEIIEAKESFDKKKLTKPEVEKAKKNSHEFIKFMIEYMQRKRGREVDRARIRCKYGEKYAEVLLFETTAFIIPDLDAQEKEVQKATVKDGSLEAIEKSSFEEMEEFIAKVEIPPKVFIHERILENLKKLFGKNVEVLLNY